MGIEETLEERGSRYGDYSMRSTIAQHLQDRMRTTSGWQRLSCDKKQSLTVIADKIARILSGDPDYRDNWHDIQGYAKLAEDRCRTSDAEDVAEWSKAVSTAFAKISKVKPYVPQDPIADLRAAIENAVEIAGGMNTHYKVYSRLIETLRELNNQKKDD